MTKPNITAPPTPKYWVGEQIAFECNGSSKTGVINTIVVDINILSDLWQVRYEFRGELFSINEERVLGPCIIGEKR